MLGNERRHIAYFANDSAGNWNEISLTKIYFVIIGLNFDFLFRSKIKSIVRIEMTGQFDSPFMVAKVYQVEVQN